MKRSCEVYQRSFTYKDGREIKSHCICAQTDIRDLKNCKGFQQNMQKHAKKNPIDDLHTQLLFL